MPHRESALVRTPLSTDLRVHMPVHYTPLVNQIRFVITLASIFHQLMPAELAPVLLLVLHLQEARALLRVSRATNAVLLLLKRVSCRAIFEEFTKNYALTRANTVVDYSVQGVIALGT